MPSKNIEPTEDLLNLRNRIISLILNLSAKRMIIEAIEFATTSHSQEFRDEGTPYIFHPLSVALICLEEFGVVDTHTVLLTILHDVPEKIGGVPSGEKLALIADKFGSAVASDIDVLSRKVGSTREERDEYYTNAIAGSSLSIRLAKLADRIDNVRSLKFNPDLEKRIRYKKETIAQILPIATSTFPKAAEILRRDLEAVPLSV